MRALRWHGKHDIRCDTVADPIIEEGATQSSKFRPARFAGRICICLMALCRLWKVVTLWAMNSWEK